MVARSQLAPHQHEVEPAAELVAHLREASMLGEPAGGVEGKARGVLGGDGAPHRVLALGLGRLAEGVDETAHTPGPGGQRTGAVAVAKEVVEQTLAAGSAGCIAAFGNIFPKTVVRIFDLWTQGKVEQAMELQRTAALAESLTKAGIANTKYAAAVFTGPRAGIVGAEELMRPRRPYEEPAAAVKQAIREKMKACDEVEASL